MKSSGNQGANFMHSLITVFLLCFFYVTNAITQEIPLIDIQAVRHAPLRKDTNQKKIQIKFYVAHDNMNYLGLFGHSVDCSTEIENGFPKGGVSLSTRREGEIPNTYVIKPGYLFLHSVYAVGVHNKDEEFIFYDNSIWSFSHYENNYVYFNLDYSNEDEMKKYGNNIVILPFDSSVLAYADHIAKQGDVGARLFTLSLRTEFRQDNKLLINVGTNQLFDVNKREIISEFKESRNYSEVKDGDMIEILPGEERKITVVKPEGQRRGYILFDLNKAKEE